MEKYKISLIFFSCNQTFKCRIKGFFIFKAQHICQEMSQCWLFWVNFPEHGIPFWHMESSLLFQESFFELYIYLLSLFVLVHFIFNILRESNTGSPLPVFYICSFIMFCNSFPFVSFYPNFVHLSLCPFFCFLQCLCSLLYLHILFLFLWCSIVSTSFLSFVSHISLVNFGNW